MIKGRKIVMTLVDRQIRARVYRSIADIRTPSVLRIIDFAHRDDCFRIASIVRHKPESSMGRLMRAWGGTTITEWADANEKDR